MKVEFAQSVGSVFDCPNDGKPDVAFIGRSNVGKSSLLNRLAGNARLAYVSSTPGKTQSINHYLVDDSWYLVDLPGFGYAARSQKERARYERMVESYFLHRASLYNVYFLVDSRHEPLHNDEVFLRWLGEQSIPVSVVFTKSDKLSERQLGLSVARYRAHLEQMWNPLPPLFVTSAQSGRGREEILAHMASYLGEHWRGKVPVVKRDE